MDPNAALARLRDLANGIDKENDHGRLAYLAEDMAVVFEGLDDWLSNGGFLPAEWRRP
jgi:hypothetical protein